MYVKGEEAALWNEELNANAIGIPLAPRIFFSSKDIKDKHSVLLGKEIIERFADHEYLM